MRRGTTSSGFVIAQSLTRPVFVPYRLARPNRPFRSRHFVDFRFQTRRTHTPIRCDPKLQQAQYHQLRPARLSSRLPVTMGLSTIKSLAGLVFVFTFTAAAAAISCFFQALSYLLVRPFSLPLHRRIAVRFTHAFFLISTFILEVWSNITFKMHGDSIPYQKSTFFILNHSSSLDFLIGLAYLAKLGYPYPGNAKSAVKSALGNVPLFGTILYFAEFLFLSRSWASDRRKFVTSLLSFRNFEETVSPLCFVLFPEGTRLTQDRLQRSHNFTTSIGEPELNHVLYPRFKGFTTVLETMRDRLEGVVDATLIFEGGHPSLKDSLAGKCSTVVHAHTRFYSINELPTGEEQLQKWLRDRWYEKEQRIAAFHQDKSSLGKENDSIFPVPKPSLLPLYGLVAAFVGFSIMTIYLFSKIPNGILIFTTLFIAAIVVVGVLTMIGNRPSRQGSSRQSNRTSKRQESRRVAVDD